MKMKMKKKKVFRFPWKCVGSSVIIALLTR